MSADGFYIFGLCAVVTWLKEYLVKFANSFPPSTEYKVLQWFVVFNTKHVFALYRYCLPTKYKLGVFLLFLKIRLATIYAILKGIHLTSRAVQV